MPPDLARSLRLRMTLRQFGVLVAFAAVSLAVLKALLASAAGPVEFALQAGAELPYALLIPTLVLVRRGPLKLWMMTALCGIPFVVLLAYLNYVALAHLDGLMVMSGTGPLGMALLVVFGVVDAILLAALMYYARRLIPRACPTCRWGAMLLDPAAPRLHDFPRPSDARSCLACGSRFRRARGGPWVDVDAPPPGR